MNTGLRDLSMTYSNAGRAGAVHDDDTKRKKTSAQETRDRFGKADNIERPTAAKFYGKSRRERVVSRDGKLLTVSD